MRGGFVLIFHRRHINNPDEMPTIKPNFNSLPQMCGGTERLNMNINMEALQTSFVLMGQGMLGIFLVMAAIALIVWLFTKFAK